HRNRAPPADAARRSPCAARTGSPATRPDPATACDPGSGSAARPSATAAPSAPTTRPTQTTAHQPSAPPQPCRQVPTAFVVSERVPSFRFEFLVPLGEGDDRGRRREQDAPLP